MNQYITLIFALFLNSAVSYAALITDGDFEALTVGNAPDVSAPAGSWNFPTEYVEGGVAETNLSQYTIAYDPATPGAGRCLHLEADATIPGNQHLVNLLSTPATSTSLTLQVDFDIYVSPGRGGGSVYLGNGGYGARGPQLVWFPSGALVAVDQNSFQVVLTNDYTRGTWQSVRLMIHLPSGTYGCYWAEQGSPLQLLATGLTYRSGFQTSLDRITVARFEAVPDAQAWYDNFFAQVSGVAPQPPEIIEDLQPWVMIPPSRYWTNLAITASGDEPLTYQWYRDEQPIPGATEPTYLAEHDPFDWLNNGNRYFVVVSNAWGAATSAWSHVVQGFAPYVINHPQSSAVRLGEAVSFDANVIGLYVNGLVSFPQPAAVMQWWKDEVSLPGETNVTLTIPSAGTADAGDYKLIASNYWGQVTSATAHLNVLPAVALNIHPVIPNAVAISFLTQAGYQYVTEHTTDLETGNWSAIATNNGSGEIISFTHHTVGHAGFFRLRIE